MKKNEYRYVDNRKARYNYYVLDTYVAGISLNGSEVKSLKDRKVDLSESYCLFNKSFELFLKNCYIYKYNNIVYTREENVDRKLLLTKKELKKIRKIVEQPGYSIIPLAIMIPTYGYIKIKIGVCKGKKKYDKRESIKERDIKRENKRYKL